MIVNVPDGWWEVVQAGQEACREAKFKRTPVENPYDVDDIEHDYWKLGFMAAEHGWDVEY